VSYNAGIEEPPIQCQVGSCCKVTSREKVMNVFRVHEVTHFVFVGSPSKLLFRTLSDAGMQPSCNLLLTPQPSPSDRC